MSIKCVIGKLRHISAISDKFISMKAKEMNLSILKNHIPMFYILPEDGSMMIFNNLAKQWDISKSSLSDIVNKYTQLGFVEKHECSEDKRAIYLRLTKEGVEVKRKMESIEQKFKEVLYKDMSIEDQRTFEKLLDQVESHLDV